MKPGRCALGALRAALIGGQFTEDAVAEGQRWGLKSLQPFLRDRLKPWNGATARQATAPPFG